MKSKILLGLLMLLVIPGASAVTKQSTFSIYLVEGDVDPRIFRGTEANWDNIKLSSEPLITEGDVISYDFSKHAMKLKPESTRRIPRPPVHGSPFVVVVNGQRIYLGAFYSSFSSITCAVPVVVVDRSRIQTDQPEDVLLIERAYPPSKGTGSDMRSDERIRNALRDLNKL